jgi:hypothetical protein
MADAAAVRPGLDRLETDGKPVNGAGAHQFKNFAHRIMPIHEAQRSRTDFCIDDRELALCGELYKTIKLLKIDHYTKFLKYSFILFFVDRVHIIQERIIFRRPEKLAEKLHVIVHKFYRIDMAVAYFFEQRNFSWHEYSLVSRLAMP